MPRLHSLKGRLLLAITVLVIGSGLVISSLVAYRYSRMLYSAATTHAENLSHQIALQAADKILINDLVSLQKLIDQHIRSHSSLSYLFVLRDGDVLAHSFADGFPANLIGANRSDPGGEGSIIRIQNETGEDFLDFAHPILEGKAGVLRMGVSEQPLRRQVNGLWVQMMLITAAILCAGITIGHLFLKRITGPLSVSRQGGRRHQRRPAGRPGAGLRPGMRWAGFPLPSTRWWPASRTTRTVWKKRPPNSTGPTARPATPLPSSRRWAASLPCTMSAAT